MAVDPRWVPIVTLLGGPAPSDNEVWFAAQTDPGIPIRQIAFRHGLIDARGGWFLSDASCPRVEVARAPLPLLNNVIRNFWTAKWEPVGDLPGYPEVGANGVPRIDGDREFALTFDTAQTIHAIRVVGSAGRRVTCRSLAAFAA